LPWSSTARIARKRLARAGIEYVWVAPAAWGAGAPDSGCAAPKFPVVIRLLDVATW
jgi:hypothetical protein